MWPRQRMWPTPSARPLQHSVDCTWLSTTPASMAEHAAYAASKHGVHGLTRTAAHDYAGDKVRINELLPGVIDTPMLDSNRAMVDQMTAFIPQRRLGQPAEVARAICFLLGES